MKVWKHTHIEEMAYGGASDEVSLTDERRTAITFCYDKYQALLIKIIMHHC